MRCALVEAAPRVLRALELPALLAVPVVMVATAAAGLDVTAGLTLAVAVLAVGLLFASFEASRPPLRQLMPTAVLAATAAAGRVLFAPIPDVKPVSAIAIVAGAALGQGSWTPWQMYAWGLVGYFGGVLSEHGALERTWALYAWGFVSALMYGAILNGYYVLGFVRPLTWPAVVAAYAAGAPLDIVHGIATAGFLAVIWLPWGRAIRRVVAKYDLATR